MEFWILVGVVVLIFCFVDSLGKKSQPQRVIKKTKIINNINTSRKSATSSVARGLVGGVLLGPIGALGGIASGKSKQKNETMFLIIYEDGTKDTMTVSNNSQEFYQLIQYLEDE